LDVTTAVNHHDFHRPRLRPQTCPSYVPCGDIVIYVTWDSQRQKSGCLVAWSYREGLWRRIGHPAEHFRVRRQVQRRESLCLSAILSSKHIRRVVCSGNTNFGLAPKLDTLADWAVAIIAVFSRHERKFSGLSLGAGRQGIKEDYHRLFPSIWSQHRRQGAQMSLNANSENLRIFVVGFVLI